MTNRKRPKQSKKETKQKENLVRSYCANCDTYDGPHFAPPSLGEEGFFICKPKPPGLVSNSRFHIK